MRPSRWLSFIAARLDRRRLDREMDDEMALHIELHAETLVKQGIAPDEAKRRARAEFGGVQNYREQGRDARALSWTHDLIGDLRYGARALRRSPGFTLVAVLSLGIGIGANTAMFGLLYGILLQRLPIANAEQLSVVTLNTPNGRDTELSRANYQVLRTTPRLPRLEAGGGFDHVLLEAGNVHDLITLDLVSGGFFEMLGVRPVLGRYIVRDDDESGAPVAMISEESWERFFGRDPGILGRRVSLNGQPFTVIGVMPAAFRGIEFNGRFTMAVPHRTAATIGFPDGRGYLFVIARVGASESRASVAAPIDAAYHRLFLDGKVDDAAQQHISLIDASRGIPFSKNDFRDDYRRVLIVLMGGVFLVLMIACSNVGNLLLARGAAREREFAVRLSIGASRGRVVRQLLAESSLLAVLGGGAGLVLAAWGTGIIIGALPANFQSETALIEFHLKPAILAFTAAVSATCVFAFGLGPALRATRGDLASSLKERSAAWRGRVGGAAIDRVLVIGQVAGALLLVCAAGLLVATVRNLRTIDPGFASDHLIMMNLETRGTPLERDGIVPIHREVLDLIRHVPGVQAAGMSTRVPSYGGRNSTYPYAIVGQTAAQPAEIDLTGITPGYFTTAGTRMIAGRDFDANDVAAGQRAAIVNEAFAKKHFADRSAIGGQVRLDRLNGGETVTVIGVVQDVRFGDRRSRQEPMIYVPATQIGSWPYFCVMIRSSAGADPRTLIGPVERAVASYSRSLRQLHWQTMAEAFDEVLLRERLAAGLGSVLAALAIGLAMVGLAGVVGFAVTRRSREIGVRMALGARRADVVWLVLRGSLAMVVTGVVIGAPLTFAAGRAIGAMLFGVAPTNPVFIASGALALLLVGVGASALPAWRAARIDPVTSLRAD